MCKGLFTLTAATATETQIFFPSRVGSLLTLWKCSHGVLWQRQQQPIGSNTIHSFRCRCQCERALKRQQYITQNQSINHKSVTTKRLHSDIVSHDVHKTWKDSSIVS